MVIAQNETINSWMIDFSTNHSEIPTNLDYYIESLFFMSYTLSSVGYGAYSTVISDENENIYKMFIMAIGGIIYALINMSMKYVIMKLSMNDMLMNHSKDEIILFLMTLNKNNEYLFPNKLWNDIKILLVQMQTQNLMTYSGIINFLQSYLFPISLKFLKKLIVNFLKISQIILLKFPIISFMSF